ncbi:hypothetical protein TruAng_009395 [Truncatella angustata]|nr:hypothetical protein TruAng_009395 [Truncatella angustata]
MSTGSKSEIRRHAVVFGASGLIGWSCVNQLLLKYPRKGSFEKVTAVTNRPVKLEESFWPTESTTPELRLVSGIDLAIGDGRGVELAEQLKREGINGITHVYYFDVLNAPLQFVVFPGGTRGYGIYTPGGTFTPPLQEDMVRNLPSDYAKTVAYPVFREVLTEASKEKPWTWCEVCPDAIIGFTPNGSQFSLALHWAQYLSLYAHHHGRGARVPFPGIEAAYLANMTPVSAGILARFAIYASLNPDKCGAGQLFNVGDSAEPTTFGHIWPRLAEWFGLVGDGPLSSSSGTELEEKESLMPGEYIAKHRGTFDERRLGRAEKAGVSAGSLQLDSVGTWLTFDRQLSLDKLRSTGFEEERDVVEGWLEAFRGFKEAGLIL